MTFLHEAGVGRGGQGWGAARLFPQAKQGTLSSGNSRRNSRCLWPRSHLCRSEFVRASPEHTPGRDGESSSGSAGGGKAQC